MVLTNIELWAADGSAMPLDFETNNSHTRHINPFDPRVVPQLNSNLNHLASNGYYGFSYVNNIEVNNNNDTNINNNNNNTTTCNLMANDVNGMNNATATIQQTYTSSANFGGSACAAGHGGNVARCKKRFFVVADDDDVISSDCANTKNKNYYGNNNEISAKRCRFDDDYSAQYFNDFFQLPSTQIATQSCLMDTEEGLQPQQLQQQYLQQQADEAMFVESNNNNIVKYEQQKLNPQLSDLSADQHEPQHNQQTQQLLQQQHQQEQQQESQQQQQQPLYHQQQHYQDIQFATNKCHFKYNNSSDMLALNSHTSEIDLQKNTENILKIHTPNRNSSIKIEQKKYNNDNDVANDLKVDDATLFEQLHGGCLHNYKNNFNNTDSFRGDLIAKRDAINNHHLQHDHYYAEF